MFSLELYLSFIAIGISLISPVIAFQTYKKASSMKCTDLRIELKKEVNKINKIYKDLIPLMKKANDSRHGSLGARGLFQSGIKVKWDNEHSDNEEVINSSKRFIKSPYEYKDSLSQAKLENEIITINKVSLDLIALNEYYNKSLFEDNEHSKELMSAAIRRRN